MRGPAPPSIAGRSPVTRRTVPEAARANGGIALRTYLAIALTRAEEKPRLHALVDIAEALAPEALPYPPEAGRSTAWVAPSGTSALLAWSNEPDDPLLPALLHEDAEMATGYTGYLADDPARLLTTAGPDLGRTVEEAAGCFAVFRATSTGFEAATTTARVDPVYFAHGSGAHLAGSRALLVHLVARAAETGTASSVDPAWALHELHPLVRQGFFTTDATPFTGVTALPGASVVRVADGSRTITTRPPSTPAAERLTRETVGSVADALVRAVEPLRHHPTPPELALSGGRDSRILAAALHAAGIPFTASTRGFEDHPDVVVARMVAKVLGVTEHRVYGAREDPDRRHVVVEHPLERANRAVWISEGMNSAMDDLTGFVGFKVMPRMSGSGGEVVRGGYLVNQANLAPGAIRRRVERTFLDEADMLEADAAASARRDLEAWISTAGADRPESLARLYLRYRIGRWLVGPRTSTIINWTYYHPFLDNRLVQLAETLPAREQWNERAAHALISRLAPQLRDLPIADKRWRWEAQRPTALGDVLGWRRRRAVVKGGGTSGFDWRRHHDRAFVDLLRDAVMDGPAELFSIVRRDKAAKLFDSVPVGKPLVAWRLLTIAVLLSGTWRRGAWSPFEQVTVPIPGR